jgi:hypothetical protein
MWHVWGRDSFVQDFGGTKPEGKKKLGRPRPVWDDSIKWNLREIGWKGIEWIGLAQRRDSWWVFVRKEKRWQELVGSSSVYTIQ